MDKSLSYGNSEGTFLSDNLEILKNFRIILKFAALEAMVRMINFKFASFLNSHSTSFGGKRKRLCFSLLL